MKSSLTFADEVVDHIRNCFYAKEVYKQLLEFFDRALYERIAACQPLYVALPFWSQNARPKSAQATADNDEGWWSHLPCFVADRDITLAYALFFSAFSELDNNFSFSRWVARSQGRHIPSLIEFHRSPEVQWPTGDIVRVEPAGHFAPKGAVQSLRIQAPYIEGLAIKPPYSRDQKDLCAAFTTRRRAALDILDFERLSKAEPDIRRLFAAKLVELKSELQSAAFEQYHTTLRTSLEKAGVLRRLGLDRKSSRGLAIFLTQYSILPTWRYAYHFPSKTILAHLERDDQRKRPLERGSGGPIIVSRESLGETANSLSAAINLEYRVMSLNDWVRNGRIKVQEQALRTAVAAIMARNASHNTGSHGLSHLINDRIIANPQQTKAFLTYIKTRMDFVADVTTYWRTLPWLERQI